MHEVSLNGARVGDHLLDPGWTAYGQRLLVTSHDVTDLLAAGPNVLAGRLGDGWYRGRLGWDPQEDRCRYGRQVGLLAQLEVELPDGSTVTVGTDGTWRASTGEVRSADLYDGCAVDLRHRQQGWDRPGFDDSGWAPAAVVPLDPAILQPRVAPPVRVVQTFRPERSVAPGGAVRLDAGQNVAGVVRLDRPRPGRRHRDRAACRGAGAGRRPAHPLAALGQGDRLVRAGRRRRDRAGAVVHLPRLPVRRGDHRRRAGRGRGRSRSAATPRPRATFDCSDPALTRFHENVQWSQRDNFVAVPTDCPQRDERLGWTGDAQAFAPTACTLFDSRAFWESWLVDLAHDQTADGAVPSVVPNVLGDGPPALGRAGWADAATIVPWAVHVAYADTEVLAAQLPSMRALVSYLQGRRQDDGLLGGEFQFGDWLDPDAPGDRPHEAKTSSDYLANAFFAHSARLVARAATVLGDAEQARTYAALADDVAGRTWDRWREHALTTQTGCAVALELGIAPAAAEAEVGRALAGLVRDAGGRIATGFLGTPLVLPALTRTGHLAEAYLMLLRHELPSWLYQVDRGATTVWERWDAIRADGSIHDGVMHMPDGDSQMLSFNHYAYGAVVDWVYRTLAGLAPDPDAPGYRHVVLAPRPVAGIDRVSASVATALGPVAVDWATDGGTFTATYQLPFGTTGTLLPPAGPGSVVSVDGREVSGSVTLGPGAHRVSVTGADIASPMQPSLR